MLDLRSRPHCGAHALPPVAREGDTPSGCPTLQVSRQMYASSPCSSLINCVVKHFHMLRPAENVFAWQVVYRWTGWQHHPHGQRSNTYARWQICASAPSVRDHFYSCRRRRPGRAHGEPAVARNNYGRRKKNCCLRDVETPALRHCCHSRPDGHIGYYQPLPSTSIHGSIILTQSNPHLTIQPTSNTMQKNIWY